MSNDPKPGAESLKEFLSEGEEIIEKLGRDLIALDHHLRRQGENDGEGDGAPADGVEPELLNNIFRGAHSLKGLSGMFGFRDLTTVSHNLENLLDALRLGRVTLDASILDLLFAGLDLLSRQLKTVGAGTSDEGEGGGDAEQAEILAFIGRLNAAAGRSRGAGSAGGAAGIDPAVLAVLTEFEEHRLEENLRAGRAILSVRASFDLATFDQGLADLTARLRAQGELITTLPSSAPQAPGQISFDVVLGTERPVETVHEAVSDLDVTISILVGPGGAAAGRGQDGRGRAAGGAGRPSARSRSARRQPRAAPGAASSGPAALPGAASGVSDPGPPAGANGQAAAGAEAGGEASLRSTTQTVRVEVGRLDALMTIVGELVLERTVIAGIADHLKQADGTSGLASALAKATRSLGKKLTELQERVMEVRMVPLSQAFDKMARTVRKLSRDAGKDMDLTISGSDTELDKLIVEEIVDPLMHIIRNAIDHGIEPPEVRRAAGKPLGGRIELRAYQKGNHVAIEVADDGRGLDFDRVREVAVARGLLPADAPPLKPREAFDLLCMPGFSTRDAVTEISGRGVGMDVVRTSIGRLSGMLDFETAPGRGTKILITLPMTLAIIQALVVSTCGRTYAIPLNQVQENFMIAPGEVRTVDGREVIQLRERTLPVARIEQIFRLTSPEGWRPGASRRGGTLYVVVVGIGERSMGFVVDELIGQQDVVVKSIGDLLKGIRGIAGAADLGDQQTILVLDVGTMIEDAIQQSAGRRRTG